jgi:hypothetical protein
VVLSSGGASAGGVGPAEPGKNNGVNSQATNQRCFQSAGLLYIAAESAVLFLLLPAMCFDDGLAMKCGSRDTVTYE